MDLLRIKSRSRSPTRAAAEHKRQSTTSPARSAFTAFGGDRGDRNSSGGSALDEKQTSSNASAVEVVELSFPSLLNPPNPAFVSGSEARGILINARRPTSRERGTLGDSDLSRVRTTSTLSSTGTGGGHSSTSTVSSPVKGAPTSAAPASALSQSRPALRGSASADSLPKAGATPESSLPGSSGLSTSIGNSARTDAAAASSASNFGSRKIRFAPLPDPRRPRRYSTGRDIWLDEDPDNVHINSRGGVEARTDEWGTPGAVEGSADGNGGLAGGDSLSLYPSPMSIPGSSSQGYAGSEDSGMSPGSGLFGSVSSTTSAGNAGGSSHKRGASTGSSLTSKLLNPLKLGRSSKDRELKRTTSLESNGGGAGGSLSTSGPVSPALASWLTGSTEPLGRRISTGIVGDQPSRERARAEEFRPTGIPMRLSTTQESDGPGAGMPRPRKAYPSVAQGGRGRRRQIRTSAPSAEPVFREWTNPTLGGSNVDEEDGSGMAWLKKRRAEREAKEKEEKERAAREAAGTPAAADGNDAAAGPAEATAAAATLPSGAGDAGGSDLPILQVTPDTPGLVGHPAPLVGAEQRVNASEGDLELDAEEDGNDVDGSRRRSLSEDGMSGDDDASDDESSDGGDNNDDDNDNDDDDDDSDDLTQAELEEEERLVEEARRTTEGAGREVFHSHEHHASTHRVDKGSRQNSLVAPLSSGTATPTLAGARSVDASRRGSPVPHSASPDRYAGPRPVVA